MTNYTKIDTVLEILERGFSWPHSFIREYYFITESCMHEFTSKSGETAPGDTQGPQHIRLAVAYAGNPTDTGIEFLFRNVNTFSINYMNDLSFSHRFDHHNGHLVDFINTQETGRSCWICAESAFVRFLGKSYLGIDLMLGFEFPTDKAYKSAKIEGCWRQCENCKNIWEEHPKVIFSRCPDCGTVTQLIT